MFKNYFKITIRNLLKYKAYSLINIFSLAIGVACCLLILLYINDELSYDKHFSKSDRIYRIAIHGAIGNTEFSVAVSAAPLGPTLLNDFPEVQTYTRFTTFGFPVIRYKDNVFSEERFYWADSTFFDVFDFEFIKGDPEKALSEPNSVVITESSWRKYFGSEDPIGKLLNADNTRDYEVTGVIKDFPSAMHFHFDFIGSFTTYDESRNQIWVNNSVYTYIVLKEGSDQKEFETKLEKIVSKYVGPQIEQALSTSFEELKKQGAVYEYLLQPLTAIHLNSDLENEIEANSQIEYVYIFSLIAILILLIACINFTNLATARSSNRAKEIGIRKTLGSNRGQLIQQFLIETVILSVIAVGISIIAVELLLAPFNELIGKALHINYLGNPGNLLLLFTLAVVVGTIAGIYPALFLSSYNPVKVLKKNILSNSRNSVLRNILVISQFTISIILIIGTIVIYNQLEYIRNKKLGFEKEQVLVVQKTDDLQQLIFSFQEELMNIPGVKSVSNSTTLIGRQFNSNTWKVPGKPGNDSHILWNIFTDHGFTDTYGIKMSSGRFYSEEWKTDGSAIVLNQKAVESMGIQGDPVGQQISQIQGTGDSDPKFTIIGVCEDFHFESLQQSIKPMAIRLFREKQFGRFISVRLAPGNYKEKITNIKELWRKFAGLQAFEYFFFSDDFSKTYWNEERTGIIATVFSILAIIVACLGLLGLASFIIEQRTKEIGIRKVLGASVPGIILMLSKEFIKWVLIANIIAWPVAYYFMNEWLRNYAYRIDLGWYPFILSALLAIVIAVLTVSFQSLKAAIANPVNSLKCE